jgi:hypothetical protein
MEEDPRGPELNQALGYVSARVEKGPVLVSAFLKALAEPEQATRRKGAMRCYRQIELWAGF